MPAQRPQLAAARVAAGYTQERLAEYVGVAVSTVRRWEFGTSGVRLCNRPGLAEALGLTGDRLAALLEEPGRTTPGATLAHSARADDQPAELPYGDISHDGHALLALVDRTRLLVDHTLSTGTGSTARLGVIEDRVADHVQAHTRTAPTTVLQTVAPDLTEIQSLAAQRQPAALQSRLSEATSVLALLTADALMKLGHIGRARYWYDSARLAADDTPNLRLRAQVLAQEAMLPYYYGDVRRTVALAREARALVPNVPCPAAALAAAAEGRALARLGDRDGAELAMRDARDLVDRLDEPAGDAAFQFDRKRLLLYLSGTLTYLHEIERARPVQHEALTSYCADPRLVIDPALIRLDQAVGEARNGDVEAATELAVATLAQLPVEHRTRIVLARLHDVIAAVPSGRRGSSAVTDLRELVTTQENTT